MTVADRDTDCRFRETHSDAPRCMKAEIELRDECLFTCILEEDASAQIHCA